MQMLESKFKYIKYRVIALFSHINKVIPNDIWMAYLYLRYGYIKSRVLEQWLNLLILKQADTFVYGNRWIYILIRANPGLDRNEQY